MSQMKTEFLNDMGLLESLLEKYKKSYPNNFGSMVRDNFPWLVLMLGIVMLIHSFCIGSRAGEDNMMVVSSCGVAPVMIALGVVMLARNKGGFASSVDPGRVRRQIVTAEKKYAEYSDVMAYLKQLREVLAIEQKRKKTIQRKFMWSFGLFFAVYVAKVIYDYTTMCYEQ